MAWFDYLRAAETAFSCEATRAVSQRHIFTRLIMDRGHDEKKPDLVSERNQMEGSTE